MGFTRPGENSPVEMLPGITRRLVTVGERAMAVRIDLVPGSKIPTHDHPHEQIGFVASGRLRFTIAGETRTLEPGDGYSIPANAPHSVDAPDGGIAIDIFSPLREDYLR